MQHNFPAQENILCTNITKEKPSTATFSTLKYPNPHKKLSSKSDLPIHNLIQEHVVRHVTYNKNINERFMVVRNWSYANIQLS